MVRAFVAVALPEDLLARLGEVSAGLQERLAGLPLRWTPAANTHLTLKFLGDVSESNLPLLESILHTEGAQVRPFDLSVGGFGVFPNPSRPRVLWVGVEAPESLSMLQRRIEGEAGRLGYPPEERPFSPHLTLARVSRGAQPGEIRKISEVLRQVQLGLLGVARVEEVRLYRSDLRPGGPVYTCLARAPLLG
jgi:2'-5' RNA ligase